METPQHLHRDRRSDALGDLRVLSDELLCSILEYLTPREVARLSCVSSVMYILCNEEPLWMTLCLKTMGGLLEYKGSWKETTLHRENASNVFAKTTRKCLQFDGFNSFFLYKRWYRCFTTLDAFSLDNGVLERKKEMSFEEFHRDYDAKKPVLLTGLAENWPARSTWTTDQLLQNYGDTPFRISQRSRKKISMKFKDYLSYMNLQHDEDPLYIFDDKFGEAAPTLLKDYSVPHLFQEDLFDVLDEDQRPPFRWLIIGPERSGASWHVDPSLTSAWNTLLCGRKRWALYPPGRVPAGVTVHVNEDDSDVHIETPSSLQWWLDFYPLLSDQDKPIECTQLPGETIFVPSGWWHCVLNLEMTIAVTQNFVNAANFEFVCLDMTPGHRHKGVSRAGWLAMSDNGSGDIQEELNHLNGTNNQDLVPKGKRPRLHATEEDSYLGFGRTEDHFFYDVSFLSKFLEEDRDHYNCIWSPSNCVGPREMRQWLHKLWVQKPGMHDLIWKGACLALNAERWSACLAQICTHHGLLSPSDDEKLPVGTGSNPVYLVDDHVIKIYVEGGLACSLYSLGTELEFFHLVSEVKSPLRGHIPDIVASGILLFEHGSYQILPWDGNGLPDPARKFDSTFGQAIVDKFQPFGVWSKKQLELRNEGKFQLIDASSDSNTCAKMWPYVVTKRCKGDIFANVRNELSKDDLLDLASFLGDQLRNLHLVSLPSFFSQDGSHRGASCETVSETVSIPYEWEPFVQILVKRRNSVVTQLTQWGDPIPTFLIEKVEEYIPQDPLVLLGIYRVEEGSYKFHHKPSWIHSDVMDDNIQMEACFLSNCTGEETLKACTLVNGDGNSHANGRGKWQPSHILDFGNLTIGDPLCDIIPIYLDVFRGEPKLLERFLESYQLPLTRIKSRDTSDGDRVNEKFRKLSYRAMCYCILNDENILGSIFSWWRELRSANSWEEVEETVWGILNVYQS